jgi:hypothetical protein
MPPANRPFRRVRPILLASLGAASLALSGPHQRASEFRVFVRP